MELSDNAETTTGIGGVRWAEPEGQELGALMGEIGAMQPEMVEQRRLFHTFPELGWLEFETTSRIAHELTALGYSVTSGASFLKSTERIGLPDTGQENTGGPQPGETGCIATYNCPRPGPVVAVRFDIDALPIEEAKAPHRPAEENWQSGRRGAMHACGHDAHIAIGLALAKVLMPRLSRGRGQLKLIFQPAEEGTRGARSVVEAGYLDDVDLFLGMHVGLGVPSGTIALGTKNFLPTKKYSVLLSGKPAHAGKDPETGRNALLAAAQSVLGLHSLAQHSEPGVRVNVGTLNAGRAANIVPGEASMMFEVRAGTNETLEEIARRAVHLVEATASAYEVNAKITLAGEATAAETDRSLALWAEKLGRSAALFKNYSMDHSFQASEDATLMMRRVQERGGVAGYFVLGSDLTSAHHTPEFDIDEASLSKGTGILCALVASAMDLW